MQAPISPREIDSTLSPKSGLFHLRYLREEIVTTISRTFLEEIVSFITRFLNLMFRGETSGFAQQLWCCNVCLGKQDGGVLLVAVGNILRHFATKVGAKTISEAIRKALHFVQLRAFFKDRCEASVHTIRRILERLRTGEEYSK